MKVKAFLTAAIVSAACLFSSCGDIRIPVENNFSQMLSADGGKPVFVSVNILRDNEATVVKLGSSLTSYSDEFVSALTSAKLSELPEQSELHGNDSMLLQIEILRNGSDKSQGMNFCYMGLFNDGALSVFGTEEFCGEGKSYMLSVNDVNKIMLAAEHIVDNRTSCPPPMRITDPLSSYSHSGAMIAPAGFSWSYTDSDGNGQSIVADALHPLDESASPVKINRLYSTAVMLEFPAGFEPDKITIKGWDISPKGDTSSETIYHPKTEYENNFPSEGDYTGFHQLESNTVYMVTVAYDNTKSAERGFSGTADYYFETGELSE
ncbi:MAG: hypothetical protein K2N26_04735 [Oscillospiraceae bacterium]|nr:hypothetical protein [Oscillospiraceae bacterium]